MNRPKLLVVVLIFALAALSGTSQESTPRLCKASADHATVYFYRVKEANYIRKGQTKLTVNGTKLLQMATSSYVGFYLSPGKYELSLGHRETDFLLNAEAGKHYFFRVSNTAGGVAHLEALTPIEEEQAIFQMSKIKPLAADNLKDNTFQRCDVEPEHLRTP